MFYIEPTIAIKSRLDQTRDDDGTLISDGQKP